MGLQTAGAGSFGRLPAFSGADLMPSCAPPPWEKGTEKRRTFDIVLIIMLTARTELEGRWWIGVDWGPLG